MYVFFSVFAFQTKQNMEVARVLKNVRASGEKQAYIKNKTQDFYCKFLQLFGIFAIICDFTITRKLTMCLFLSRRALLFD